MIPDEEVEALRQKWQEAVCEGFGVPPRLIGVQLPRRVRLRLWFHGHVDDVAYWLVCHDHCDAARRLWQICGMWLSCLSPRGRRGR